MVPIRAQNICYIYIIVRNLIKLSLVAEIHCHLRNPEGTVFKIILRVHVIGRTVCAEGPSYYYAAGDGVSRCVLRSVFNERR